MNHTTTSIPPIEFKVMKLRECPVPTATMDLPDQSAKYWWAHIQTDIRHNPDVESLVLLTLNTRRRLIGHTMISTGTLDTIMVHPREIFKPAIVASAAAIILMHNHPSGDTTPSEADIRITRDLIRAGQLLKIELLDHVIMANQPSEINPSGWCSLRLMGYFADIRTPF